MVRSRGWCFTVNNWTDNDLAKCMALYKDDPTCTYLIVGFEKGRNKTPHLQCYIHYNNQKKWTEIKDRFGSWHIEAQKSGKNVAAYCYCMEDGDYYEMGKRPRQGHRTDLEVIKHDIHAGKPMKDISKEYFSQWCQYRRSFDEYKKMQVSYDTRLYTFDSREKSQVDWVYEMYSPEKDYIIKDALHSMDVVDLFKSRRYRNLFVPEFATSGIVLEYEYKEPEYILEIHAGNKTEDI